MYAWDLVALCCDTYHDPHHGTDTHTTLLEIDRSSSLSLGITRLSIPRSVVSSIPFSPILLGHFRRVFCPQSFVPRLHLFRSTLFSEAFLIFSYRWPCRLLCGLCSRCVRMSLELVMMLPKSTLILIKTSLLHTR